MRLTSLLHHRLSAIALLAVLYILTGKLGLSLAVPPGYATFIWPPSGIALGALLLYGRALWPGVLLGSFIVNALHSNAFDFSHDAQTTKIIVAATIAVGSTLQALAGRALINRFIGIPLHLTHIKDLANLFFLLAPGACFIAATVGIATLYQAGFVPSHKWLDNWLAWYFGDVFGVFVFLPLALVFPGHQDRVSWRGRQIGSVPLIGMLVMLLLLGITFYAWKVTTATQYNNNTEQFKLLTQESEKALLQRLGSYEHALLGGAGFLEASPDLKHVAWRTYTEAIDVTKNYQGIHGIGWIEPLTEAELPAFIEARKQDGENNFNIHPETHNNPYYVVKYIEPINQNHNALGLNIGFEERRAEAATLSRDNGQDAITKRITLVQDDLKLPGFLLLHPVYTQGMPTQTVAQRQAALRGWVYAPFIAQNFFKDLTQSQGKNFNIRIYDQGQATPDNLIFATNITQANTEHKFTAQHSLNIMGQKWLVIWDSTPAYEEQIISDSPILILSGGLLLTALMGLFLLLSTINQAQTLEQMAVEKKFILPVVVFIILGGGSFWLYRTMNAYEAGVIHASVAQEADKIQLLFTNEVQVEIGTLERLTNRWEFANGTTYEAWQQDALQITKANQGLKTIGWIDPTYHVQWVAPTEGNEAAMGLNILFDQKHEDALKGAADLNTTTVTPPLHLVQRYDAVIAYAPIKEADHFDGFMAGLFNLKDLFTHVLVNTSPEDLTISFSYEGQNYFSNQAKDAAAQTNYSTERPLPFYDKNWVMQVTPSEQYIKKRQSSLPFLLLAPGMVATILSSLLVHFILLARLKSNYLKMAYDELTTKSNHLIESEVRQNHLESERKKAEELAQLKSDFLSNMSHELRTPMHAILNYAGMAAKIVGHDDHEKMAKYLGNIKLSGTRLLELLNNLLDLAKIDSHKMKFVFKRTNFIEAVDYIDVEMGSLLKEKNLSLHIHQQTSDCIAFYDQPRIIQVLVNIMSNAIKYAPNDSTIQISLSDSQLENGRNALCCSIANDGDFIPENELASIFDKFTQGSKVKKGLGSTGLGLSISQEIILAHGGKIWAENRNEASGVVVRFGIPRDEMKPSI